MGAARADRWCRGTGAGPGRGRRGHPPPWGRWCSQSWLPWRRGNGRPHEKALPTRWPHAGLPARTWACPTGGGRPAGRGSRVPRHLRQGFRRRRPAGARTGAPGARTSGPPARWPRSCPAGNGGSPPTSAPTAAPPTGTGRCPTRRWPRTPCWGGTRPPADRGGHFITGTSFGRRRDASPNDETGNATHERPWRRRRRKASPQRTPGAAPSGVTAPWWCPTRRTGGPTARSGRGGGAPVEDPRPSGKAAGGGDAAEPGAGGVRPVSAGERRRWSTTPPADGWPWSRPGCSQPTPLPGRWADGGPSRC